MILQVDAGNTRIHWRLVEGYQDRQPVVIERGHVEHGGLPEPVGRAPVTGIELACVAGEDVRDTLVKRLSVDAGLPLVEARTEGVAGGVRNSYPDPSTMGVDRWLAMVGAFNQYPGGVIVVDAGTAVTIDYVNSRGQHLGGYILPGLYLMSQALGANTARVSGGAGGFGPPVPGRSTAECVNHGIGWIWSSAAEGLRQDRQVHGMEAIVVTGGDMDFMIDLLGDGAIAQPDLVFSGMDLVFAGTAHRSGLRG